MLSLELSDVASMLARRWWLVLLVPAVTLGGLIYRDRTLPYQSMLRASVVIPGDTEIPGNAEKPELMVMDDAPGLVTSHAFAEAVAAKLGQGMTADRVQTALSSTRYSRLLSITATGDDAAATQAIATAAGEVLPAMINQYLVASPSTPATVNVIDPASEPSRSRSNQTLLIVAETCVAVVAGAFLAVLAELATRRRASLRAIRSS